MTYTNQFIRILSVNVGRSSTAHTLSLETAFCASIDILMVQEPYIHRDLSRRITCTHSAFESFIPNDDWSCRPRVITYTRRDTGLNFEQDRPEPLSNQSTSDVLFLKLKSSNNHFLTIINIYNAPLGAINPGAALNLLFSLPSNFSFKNCILAGDFNLHHSNWQPSYSGKPLP